MRYPIILMVATAALSGCQRENVEVVSYQCGDLTVSAVFRGEERAVLALGNEKLNLLLVLAASGAKYADGAGNEFWTKGLDEATLTLAGKPTVACKATDR
jgi:membrane-bound inhibitor of C-type lysozyme